MIWEENLSVLLRYVRFFVFLVCVSGIHHAHAASTPITVEDDLLGILPFDERATCDPEFWDVIKDRAWMEGQRDLTQNANLIPRPDSTLTITCFDEKLNHLAWHGDNNFPGEARYSDGKLSGFFTELMVDIDKATFDGVGDPMTPSPSALLPWPAGRGAGALVPGGLILSEVLEILVLDQLVDDVTNLGLYGLDGDIINAPIWAGVCALFAGSEKKYYVDENFPNLMLGGRARNVPPNPDGPPAWSTILTSYGGGGVDELDRSPYNGCTRMNEIWQRSKCYDFATESKMHVATPTIPSPTPPASEDHDGFYTLEQHVATAGAGNDYRRKAIECVAPSTDPIPDRPPLNGSLGDPDFLCDVVDHNMWGASVSLGDLISIITAMTGSNPDWSTAYAGAFPVPAAAPAPAGAMDQYDHYLNLRDTSACAALTPVKTGYIVQLPNGDEYVDAVCPAPGCWFSPPSPPTLAGNGTCN